MWRRVWSRVSEVVQFALITIMLAAIATVLVAGLLSRPWGIR